jgi:hypothetical protein
VSTYFLEEGPARELRQVERNLFEQAMSRPPIASFLVCDCGAMVPFGADCRRCVSPEPEPRRSLWRRLFSRKDSL